MSEGTRALVGLLAQRVAVRFVYEVSGYVSPDDRRRMYAQVQTIVHHEMQQLLKELENHKQ